MGNEPQGLNSGITPWPAAVASHQEKDWDYGKKQKDKGQETRF